MKAKILIVDDDADIVTVLEDRLQASGYTTVIARDGQQALDQIEHEAPNLILLDLDLPKLTGIEVLKRLSQIKHVEDLPVIVMTAHGSVNAAVEAMKEGAYDFLTKPLDKDHLLIVIRKALERDSLKRQVAYLRSEVDGRYASIVGASETVRAVIEAAQRAARSDAGVLLLGESGTGKELFARSIHQWSHRHAMPLIVINCVALTETLLENELFGHERGAFTGADRLQKGKLEMADAGTVFLDEIGDMSLPLQAKLLRVLQDREFQRVGGTRTVSVNIRIIAATNKDLRQAVKAGQFREDLYFRLNVIRLSIPPLRERLEDIPLLVHHYLDLYTVQHRTAAPELTAAAMDALVAKAELDLPQSIVQAEIDRLVQGAREDLKQRGVKDADKAPIPEDLFRPQAEQRVRMGLVVAELVRANSLSATMDQIKTHVEELAASYEKPEEVVRWYFGDNRRLSEVEAVVIENNVTDHIFKQAKVTDKSLPFDELMGQ